MHTLIMPTLIYYLGVSRTALISRSPARVTISRGQNNLLSFSVLQFEIQPIFGSKLEFFLFAVRFLGHFCTDLVTEKRYFWHRSKQAGNFEIPCTLSSRVTRPVVSLQHMKSTRWKAFIVTLHHESRFPSFKIYIKLLKIYVKSLHSAQGIFFIKVHSPFYLLSFSTVKPS